MSWRTVYVASHSHLSYKNGYLTIRGEEIKQVHISEIHTLIIDSNMASISVYLLNELVASKVKIIICDEKHNPNMELVPYYGAFDTSKMIEKEVSWNKNLCDELWRIIVKYKIYYQSEVLKKYNLEKSRQVYSYSIDVKPNDITNREGHAAKVYFNSLFGNDFSRGDDNNTINAFLNYGYSIILSMLNREIVSNGYITQIGIHHRGSKNHFNLSCDLMEIFRPIVDNYAKENEGQQLTKDKKLELVDLMNSKIQYNGQNQYLSNVISIFVNKVLSNFEFGSIDEKWFQYEQR